MPRVVQPGEASASTAAQPLDETPRLPIPTNAPTESSLDAPAPFANVASATGEDAALERLRAKFPMLARVEQRPAVDASNVSLMPRPPGAEEDGKGVTEATAGIRGGNGGAPARNGPRVDPKAGVSAAPARKGSSFSSFWPAIPRRDAQTAAAQVAAPMPPPLPTIAATSANEKPADADATAANGAAAAPVSVLKSGVVEGMAYTLYSDGSIEAQLPQGTLRFGSIVALRNHIESSA